MTSRQRRVVDQLLAVGNDRLVDVRCCARDQPLSTQVASDRLETFAHRLLPQLAGFDPPAGVPATGAGATGAHRLLEPAIGVQLCRSASMKRFELGSDLVEIGERVRADAGNSSGSRFVVVGLVRPSTCPTMLRRVARLDGESGALSRRQGLRGHRCVTALISWGQTYVEPDAFVPHGLVRSRLAPPRAARPLGDVDAVSGEQPPAQRRACCLRVSGHHQTSLGKNIDVRSECCTKRSVSFHAAHASGRRSAERMPDGATPPVPASDGAGPLGVGMTGTATRHASSAVRQCGSAWRARRRALRARRCMALQQVMWPVPPRGRRACAADALAGGHRDHQRRGRRVRDHGRPCLRLLRTAHSAYSGGSDSRGSLRRRSTSPRREMAVFTDR